MLHIFSTSRLVRNFYASYEQNCFLPNATSIANFEQKVLFVPNLKLVPSDVRVLIMHEACRFENFKKLYLPDEFLAFLTNSSYLFRFFEELAVEQKECDDLLNADVYAEFSEHIEILQTLLKRYKKLLRLKGYYDAITLPCLYELNTQYLKRFDSICLYMEGFLNSFEFNLFKQISKIIPVQIVMNTTLYNEKMQKLFSFDLPQNCKVKIDLNQNSFEILNKNEPCESITHKPFKLRSLQIAYAFLKINEFVNSGIKAEDIAIILPDESLVPLLKAYDFKNNLNFAMGFSFKHTLVFQKLYALNEVLKEENELNEHNITRYNLNNILPQFKFSWGKSVSYEEFTHLLNLFEFELNGEQKKAFDQELFALETVLKQISLPLSQVYKLFLQRLSKLSLDDARGGKVTVLGALETRGLTYEGVIILDFNDEFVPKFSQKDMFLSSRVRSFAGLPSSKDREDLQRYFYERAINSAKKVAITYMHNESSTPSRFLQSFDAKLDDEFDEISYSSVLFDEKKINEPFVCDSLVLPNHILNSPLSASRLKKFLTCKMGYYFEYELKILDEDVPNDDLNAVHVGDFLHKSLQELYEQNIDFSNPKVLYSSLCDILDTKIHKKSLWLLQKELWKRKLKSFCELEAKRFNDGWRPYAFEKTLYHEFNGVQIYGKIDRIDRHENGQFIVIDYKSGKIPNEKLDNITDFQLPFYYILAKKEYGLISSVAYYDLNNCELINEHQLNEKLDILAQILDELKSQSQIDFADFNEQKCDYSPYKILLGKDNG